MSKEPAATPEAIADAVNKAVQEMMDETAARGVHNAAALIAHIESLDGVQSAALDGTVMRVVLDAPIKTFALDFTIGGEELSAEDLAELAEDGHAR